MTVSAAYAPLEFAGNGVTVDFPVSWPFVAAADLLVTEVNDATGVETVKALTTHYTVTQTATGGTVTALVAPATGRTWRVERRTPKTQPDQLRLGGAYNPETVEAMIDRPVLQVQELDDRVPTFSRTQTPLAPLVYDAQGNITSGSTDFYGDLLLRPELAASTGSSLVSWIASGIGAVIRTIQAKLRDTVSIADFGAVMDGVTDDTAAVQAAVDACILSGKQLFVPSGSVKITAPITISAGLDVCGTGERTIFKPNFDGHCFEFTNAAAIGHMVWRDFQVNNTAGTRNASSGAHFVGPGTITFTRWQNVTMRNVRAGWQNDIPASAGTPGLAGGVNWTTWANCNTRTNVKYGWLFNQGSGTGNTWIGGKPATGVDGGAAVEMNGVGCNVGDMIFSGVHALDESPSQNGVFLRIGPDTTYRSRINFPGCQFDAKTKIPLDLSPVGSTGYGNIRMVDCNIGGDINLFDTIPPIARSMIRDQGASEWLSQYNGSTTLNTLYTKEIFRVTPGDSTGLSVKIVVDGGFGSEGAAVGYWHFLLRRGVSTTTILEVQEARSAAVGLGLDVTAASDANGVVTFTLAFTKGGGSAANYDCQLHATGGQYKVQNGRYL